MQSYVPREYLIVDGGKLALSARISTGRATLRTVPRMQPVFKMRA